MKGEPSVLKGTFMANNTKTKATVIDVNFTQLMSRLLGLLTDKEQDIIKRRFAINKNKKETLDKIGKNYSITRERVRQIEAVAIEKLARIAKDPSMQQVHSLALSILEANGNVMGEEQLVAEMVTFMKEGAKLDTNTIKFALRVCKDLNKQEKNQFYRPFWFTNEFKISEIKTLIKDITRAFEKRKAVSSFEDIYELLKEPPSKQAVQSLFYVDWNIMQIDTAMWGLKSWRFLNPRSIKDCIMIILKESEAPMHFRDILNALQTGFPNRKPVTPQACHNELIRHPEFVLLGRGKYGLKDWGMVAGTVCDLIVSVFKDNNFEPMKRKDIIDQLLKKRDVRLGTISLNLQKYEFFKRVGRAVYEYDESLDNRRRKKYSNI